MDKHASALDVAGPAVGPRLAPVYSGRAGQNWFAGLERRGETGAAGLFLIPTGTLLEVPPDVRVGGAGALVAIKKTSAGSVITTSASRTTKGRRRIDCISSFRMRLPNLVGCSVGHLRS